MMEVRGAVLIEFCSRCTVNKWSKIALETRQESGDIARSNSGTSQHPGISVEHLVSIDLSGQVG
jgi:hypothetical protein